MYKAKRIKMHYEGERKNVKNPEMNTVIYLPITASQTLMEYSFLTRYNFETIPINYVAVLKY